MIWNIYTNRLYDTYFLLLFSGLHGLLGYVGPKMEWIVLEFTITCLIDMLKESTDLLLKLLRININDSHEEAKIFISVSSQKYHI